jgi:hypothetical protein
MAHKRSRQTRQRIAYYRRYPSEGGLRRLVSRGKSVVKRTYEIVLVIEAAGVEAGRRAANAAWEAAHALRGCRVVNELARERLTDGSTEPVAWSDWQDEANMSLRLTYDDEL